VHFGVTININIHLLNITGKVRLLGLVRCMIFRFTANNREIYVEYLFRVIVTNKYNDFEIILGLR